MSTHTEASQTMTFGARTVQKALSDVALQNLKEPGYYWDKLPGFGVRRGKRRTTFICVRNGRRTTLGVYPHLTLADARRLATQALYATVSAPIRQSVELAADRYLNQ